MAIQAKPINKNELNDLCERYDIEDMDDAEWYMDDKDVYEFIRELLGHMKYLMEKDEQSANNASSSPG